MALLGLGLMGIFYHLYGWWKTYKSDMEIKIKSDIEKAEADKKIEIEKQMNDKLQAVKDGIEKADDDTLRRMLDEQFKRGKS